jgi:MFS transporter, ACS family, hexuronate transporter
MSLFLSRRWCITGLLFFAAVLNYVDKNTLALLAPSIQKDLSLSDQAYANIQNAFQIAYTIALLASGVIVDKLGPRISLVLFVGWWSLANILTGWARSAVSLAGCRFMLGLGEAGNWTASPKTVSEWFPPKERGLAIGIYTAGTPIGMTLAPLFIIGLAQIWDWRLIFIVTGLLGFVWIVPWLLFYRQEETRRWQKRALAEGGQDRSAHTSEDKSSWGWGEALRQPVVWCLLLGRMFSDPIWYFYQNWYPKYLVSERGLTQIEVQIIWVIFLAASLGSLAGGWLAGRLIRKGRSPAQVRVWILAGCSLFMPLSPLVSLSPSLAGSLTFASLVVFAHLAWLANITALVVDVVPEGSLGKVFGLVAAGSSIGAILMNDLVAKLLIYSSYAAWFWIAAFLHLTVVPLILWGVLKKAGGSRIGLHSDGSLGSP